jgi:hypothetical protein
MRSLRAAPCCVAAAACALTIGLTAPSAHAANRHCGLVYGRIQPATVEVVRGTTGCHNARVVMRRYLRSKAPCSGSSCLQLVRGFDCQTTPAFAYPRLASCTRGRVWIAAYAILD